eukprot:12438717-Ditylum_brightwellii.AAC.1
MMDTDIALAIGACKATFCADIVVPYIIEMTEGEYLQFITKHWSPNKPASKAKENNIGNDKACSPQEKWMKKVK